MRQTNKLFLLLALLLTAATGAWADSVTMKEITSSDIQSSWNGNTDPVKATDLPGFKAMTHDEAVALGAPSNDEKVYLIYAINADNKFAALIYESGTKSSSETAFNLKQLQSAVQNYWVYYTYSDAPAPTTYTVSLKDGVKDADKWTITPNEGLKEGDAVTLTYTGRLKVKGVKATSDEKPAGPAPITLTAKLAYTGGEIADFTDATGDLTTLAWAVGEHIAILYEVSGTKKVADAEITAVDGTTGAATITFTVEEGTPDNTPCTLVYPYTAAKDDHTGVKDAATLLAAQDGTLSANLDVRVGAGTIQTTTPGLTVTTQPEAQFAIFKFTTKSVPGENSALQNTNMTELTVTIGAQDYVITPASATSTLYAALPAVSGQTVSFTATDGSNLYAASKAGVSFDAAKYYQSTVKMGKMLEVFGGGDPFIDDFVDGSPLYKYLHIGLDQAYAIARQLSTQNGGATVAVVYNHDGKDATYALSSDNSATAHTDRRSEIYCRMFLATLWEER